MKRFQRGAIDPAFIVLIVVLIAVGGFIGWRVWETNQSTNEVSQSTKQASELDLESDAQVPEQSNENTDEQEPTNNNSNNYKYYKNSSVGFSFQYPKKWTVEDRDEGTRIAAVKDASDYRLTVEVYDSLSKYNHAASTKGNSLEKSIKNSLTKKYLSTINQNNLVIIEHEATQLTSVYTLSFETENGKIVELWFTREKKSQLDTEDKTLIDSISKL